MQQRFICQLYRIANIALKMGVWVFEPQAEIDGSKCVLCQVPQNQFFPHCVLDHFTFSSWIVNIICPDTAICPLAKHKNGMHNCWVIKHMYQCFVKLSPRKSKLNNLFWCRVQNSLTVPLCPPLSKQAIAQNEAEVFRNEHVSCPSVGLRPKPQASDSVDLGWGLNIFMFNKCIDHAGDIGSRATFGETLIWKLEN